MLRMEIALFMILAFVAFVYYTTGHRNTLLHRTFSVLLAVMLVHLVFDAVTVYTVAHLSTVPVFLNDCAHRIFIASMIFVLFLFYQYIAILVEEETGKPRKLDRIARIFLVFAEIGCLTLPIHYAVTPLGNYSDGIHVAVCYASVVVYLILCTGLFAVNFKAIERKKKAAIAVALTVQVTGLVIQFFHPTWLLSSMGLTLMTMSFYLTLENPEFLRSELVEQKLSMLYLKSQINPHFLYNTLDSIRIQAQLNGDKKVADLLMRLVDFFRRSVKVNGSVVELVEELELVEAYTDLMCYRYPELNCEYDIDPELEGESIPNFVLQPLVENCLVHGLREVGYRGEVTVTARKVSEKEYEVCISDTGSGFEKGKKEKIDEMLRNYAKQPPKMEGNSVGMLNVQKRIKMLFGEAYGLSYTENRDGGVTARLLLPLAG